MATLTVNAANMEPITIKDPKKYGVEVDKNGKTTFVVEEDDGLSNSRHTFVWENIVYITEKKYKADSETE